MPELPEVETVRRGLQPLLAGRRVVGAGSHASAKFAAAPEVVGATISGVGRRGKYLVITLDDPRRLVIHLGMTGQLRVRPSSQATDPYGRAWWHLDDDRALELRDVRRFGRVAVISDDPATLARVPTFAALGPEPFDPAFDGDALWLALRRSQVRVKTQLLGQRVVAGVGNIYADEALWRAGIHPGVRRISRAAASRLHRALVDVLTEGIEHGGTTLRDYRTVDGGIGANQYRLDCYGRAGAACPRCGATLQRSMVDGRGTTSCPVCQRR